MSTLRSVASADNLASRLRDARRSRRAQRDGTERRPRELILIAFAVPVVTVVICLVVVLAVLLMAGSGLSGTASAVAACWLAVNQVPLTIAGVTIGVLPMLPTVLVAGGTAAVVASSCRARNLGSEFVAVACSAIAGSLLVTAIALAVVMDGSSVLPIQGPDPLAAFGLTFVVQGLAAATGVAIGRTELLAGRLSVADRRGIRYGLVAVLALFAAGGVLVVLRLILKFHTVGDVISGGYDFDGYLGLTLLSVLYLPNLMFGAAAVLVGSEVHVGAVSVDLFSVRSGPVPPVPALAILPTHSVWWAAFGLAVPVLIAGFVAWRCRSRNLVVFARSVGMAAAVAATCMVVFGWLSGGRLGEQGDTGITVVTAGVFTLGWIAVLGILVGLVHIALPTLRSARTGGSSVDADEWLDDVDSAYDDTAYDDTAYDDTAYDDTAYDDTAYDDDYLVDADLADDDLADEPSDESFAYEVDGIDVDGTDVDGTDVDRTEVDGTDVDRTDVDGIGTDRPSPAARIDPDDAEDTWSFADRDPHARSRR